MAFRAFATPCRYAGSFGSGVVRVPGTGNDALGVGSWTSSGTPKSVWSSPAKTGIDGRNWIFLPLLLVINEEPRSVRQDWPAHAPAKLLQNVYWLGGSVRFADRIVGAGSGITIVVEPSSVQGVAA